MNHMNASHHLLAVCALLLIALLSARATEPPVEAETPRPGDKAAVAPEPEDHAHHVVDERFVPSKPMSVMHLVNPGRYQASSGDAVSIALTLVASEDARVVTARVATESGLEVTSGGARTWEAVEAGDEIPLEFTVSALAQGRHYVTVMVGAESEGGARRSVFSVPVEVGDLARAAPSPKVAPVVRDADGQRLKLLPATTVDER